MATSLRPRRSVLYMPGSNARALEKAKTLAADALILDLEDAVAPDAKELARAQVCEAVKAGGFGLARGGDPHQRLRDALRHGRLRRGAAASPDAILIPKVESPVDLRARDERARRLQDALWAMIETPLAILNLKEIAQPPLPPDCRSPAS